MLKGLNVLKGLNFIKVLKGLKAEGIGLRLCLRKFGVRVLRRAAAAASANMTTNPHLKLTKGDTHPTSGVKGGLPVRFRLTESYGGPRVLPVNLC